MCGRPYLKDPPDVLYGQPLTNKVNCDCEKQLLKYFGQLDKGIELRYQIAE